MLPTSSVPTREEDVRVPWSSYLGASLQRLHQNNLLRTLRPVHPTLSAVQVQISSSTLQDWISDAVTAPNPQPEQLQNLKLFSLNDYLGLSTHPAVRQAASAAALHMGTGPRSSALVGGYAQTHRDLELALASLKGTEEALLFPTGFAANLGTLAALCSDRDVDIFSDELNHASIIDGARLACRSGAGLHVYRHNDLAHLQQLLQAASKTGRRQLVVTDSLFSMDGDFADLKGLAALRRRYGFLLAIDEAHATLVCGDSGGGAAEAAGVVDQVDVHLGTLSKAFGAHGGFVAGSRDLKRFLMNKGRPYMFSTALPVPMAAAAQAALKVASEDPSRRQHLWQLVGQLGISLGVEAVSPIIPLVVGSAFTAVDLSTAMLRQGFHVPAIRPPTVPANTSRLRISLSAAHTAADIQLLVDALHSCDLKLLPEAGQPGFPIAKL